jgi:S-DNA-T family DNA segregation ATPase FtsK/SpoIIIE
MNAHSYALLLVGGAGLALAVWLLHKLGKALATIAEVIAAAAVVFIALWSAVKALVWLVRQLVGHPRTTITLALLLAWWTYLGWLSLAIAAGLVGLALLVWWLAAAVSFDQWAGRWLRAWWLRWSLYDPNLPGWLKSCGLTVKDDAVPVAVTVSLVGRKKLQRAESAVTVRVPKVVKVRSGPSWDEVRVRLVPGQKPEDFDQITRELASARKVARCQVREIAPNVVSIDFQRRNLLASAIAFTDLEGLADISGEAVNLAKVRAGTTEYGKPWLVPLGGSAAHTLVAGASGAGKNSHMWAPLISVAPAIRDGLVRVSGIDPKGMELAYGRGIFHRYAVSGAEVVALLDELVAAMNARKSEFAGTVRSVPITRENPLELVEFDEIAALTKYTDRKTREAITERVALLTTQGRALGFTVRGYVQEPTKDTVPVRELFPRRICLRVTSKTHVGMVLGDQAYERGAWANRIPESDAGTGYVWGEGIREPLRVRAGWVPDETVKALEAFVAGGAVVPFPSSRPAIEGGAAA